MKVTAIIPDDIINDIKRLSKGETTTGAIIVALSEWIKAKELQGLHEQISEHPLEFGLGFSAKKVRGHNRKRGSK
jgi:hypothetical protein